MLGLNGMFSNQDQMNILQAQMLQAALASGLASSFQGQQFTNETGLDGSEPEYVDDDVFRESLTEQERTIYNAIIISLN